MYSDIDIRKQNGTLPMHTDPLASPSRQQQGGRNSLLERLKPDTPHRGRRPADITSKEQEYLDVTAAFFGRHRRQAPQAQNSGYQDSSPLKRPQQQQKPLNPPVEPRSLGSPSANGLRTELDQNIAAEGSHLYSSGSTRLNDLYEALMGIIVNSGEKNDRVTARLEAHHKTIAKPLSETKLMETSVDKDGNQTVLQKIRIGKQVASVRERIQTLEAEVGQLWDAWEAAEQEVQTVLASMTSNTGDRFVEQTDSVRGVQESLARGLDEYNEELESILKESHEEVRVSEKEFGRKIHGVMSALLQQYLLGD